MKRIYVVLVALLLGIVAFITPESNALASNGDGVYTTIYETRFYVVGGETVVVDEFVGCAGASGDCIMVTVTAKRLKRI